MSVIVNPGVRRGNAADGFDRAGFCHHQARAAHRTAAQMHQMPRLRMPVFRGVFAHRRNHDAILKLNIANT